MLFFFKTLIAWRRFIIVCGIAGAVIMGVISFVLPSWYRATTSLFPPEPTSSLPISAELVQQLSAPLLGPIATGASPETVYIEMLKSRTIDEKIIEEFNLMKRYGCTRIEEALDAFRSHCGFTLLDSGILIVTFEDRDPDQAAKIANRMIDLLDNVTRGLKVSRAGRTRDFVERQLLEREKLLAQSEDDLRDFQEKNNTIDLDEQLRSAMDLVTDLSARAISLETEMQIMTHYSSTSSQEYQRKKTEYNEVVSQLQKLKGHEKASDEDLVRAFIPALADVPEVALQYMRLKRAVEVQTAVYKMLVSEYEKARIEEARDTPVVQVLDHAEAPTLRARPKRKLLILIGGAIGLGWSAIIAFFVTAWRERRGHTDAARELLGPIAEDFARLRRNRQP